jgi:hypothetical protein
MAYFKNHWKAKEGKVISASGLAEIAKTCDWITKLRVAAPLTLSNIAGGPLIGVALPPSGAQLAITTSAGLTARVGTTAGHGTVNPVMSNGSTFALTTNTSVTITVLNFSSTTGGIAGGTYVWIQQDPSGNWFAVSADCGNSSSSSSGSSSGTSSGISGGSSTGSVGSASSGLGPEIVVRDTVIRTSSSSSSRSSSTLK